MKKSKQKFSGTELTEEDFKSSQSKILTKNKSIEEIYDILNSNELTKRWKLEVEESKIIGKTRISWSSWGEKIMISDMNDKIKIESKFILGIVLFDNGTNKENVNFLKGLIEK